MAHRFVVVGKKGARRTFTDVHDAVDYAQRKSRTKRGTIMRVCEGQAGSEKLIVTCAKTRCTKPHPKQPKMCFPRHPLRRGDVAHLGGVRRRKRR